MMYLQKKIYVDIINSFQEIYRTGPKNFQISKKTVFKF